MLFPTAMASEETDKEFAGGLLDAAAGGMIPEGAWPRSDPFVSRADNPR
jgi:hypothetical protein